MNYENDLDLKRQAMLQHQANINALNEKLEVLKKTVAQNENELTTLLAEKPKLEKLNQQYEDALAAYATGETDDADYARLATEIEAEKNRLAALEPEIENREKTISGLRRKVSEQEQVLSTLRDDSEKVIRSYLLAESNTVGQRYLAIVGELLKEYRRLEGLALLLGELKHSPHISPAGSVLALPAYNLSVFEGKRDLIYKNLVFNAITSMQSRQRIDLAILEKKRIQEIGIDLHIF